MVVRIRPAEGLARGRVAVVGTRQAAADQAVVAAGQGLAAPTVVAEVAGCHRCSSWCHLKAMKRGSPWGSHQCFAPVTKRSLEPGTTIQQVTNVPGLENRQPFRLAISRH